ncbi:hypothetical protein NDU88_007024 [Pleurodeles waltl]|uniref:Uncharacterized protein n=1 Tax=Pleurodeles waltl TaxID=8319 RepID=A0AAV7VSC7_PLEWA|nr:hypothetical protein NDU88_007024 [Pleurodeles waltl]
MWMVSFVFIDRTVDCNVVLICEILSDEDRGMTSAIRAAVGGLEDDDVVVDVRTFDEEEDVVIHAVDVVVVTRVDAVRIVGVLNDEADVKEVAAIKGSIDGRFFLGSLAL